MSFILDALKKSDKKRLDTSVPELQTVHSEQLSGRRRRSWLPLLILVLCINAAVLAWYFSSVPPPATVAQQAAVKQPAVPATAAPALPAAASPAPQQLRQEPPTPAAASPILPSVDRIFPLAELPSALRSRLPALQMSVHAYNPERPSASLVRINGQILREGAQLEGRLRLESITADGAVLSSEGIRFLLPRRDL